MKWAKKVHQNRKKTKRKKDKKDNFAQDTLQALFRFSLLQDARGLVIIKSFHQIHSGILLKKLCNANFGFRPKVVRSGNPVE